MKAKNTLVILIGISIILSFSFLIYLFKAETRTNPLPILGQVPDFQLYDSNGQEFNSSNLKGKVWVADFIFTSCGGICPIMTKNMAQLQRSFQMMNDAHFVSFSVNPDYDSPAGLNGFAKKYNADTRNWHFLTGQRDAITHLTVQGFKMGSIDEPIFHSAKFALVDQGMRIRGYYEGTESSEIAKLFKDMANLMKEKTK